MAELIDLDELQKAVDAMNARSEPIKKGAAIENVIARLQIDVEGPMTIWRAKEFNLSTDPNFILEAIITAFVANVMGEIKQVLHTKGEQAGAVNGVMLAVSQKFAGTLMMSDENWRALATLVEPVEAGTA